MSLILGQWVPFSAVDCSILNDHACSEPPSPIWPKLICVTHGHWEVEKARPAPDRILGPVGIPMPTWTLHGQQLLQYISIASDIRSKVPLQKEPRYWSRNLILTFMTHDNLILDSSVGSIIIMSAVLLILLQPPPPQEILNQQNTATQVIRKNPANLPSYTWLIP